MDGWHKRSGQVKVSGVLLSSHKLFTMSAL